MKSNSIRRRPSIKSKISGVSKRSQRLTLFKRSELLSAIRVLAPYTLYYKRDDEVQENETFEYYKKGKPDLLLKDLNDSLNNVVNLNTVLRESSWMLKQVTKATGHNLYFVDKSGNEIYLASNKANERNRLSWTIRKGTTVAAYVAYTLDYIMVDNVNNDSRFPQAIAYNPLASATICCPIMITKEDCFAVIELYRKINESPFTNDDLEFALMVTTWISCTIYENFHRLAIEEKKELNKYLLDLTRCYFSDPTLLKDMISEMVKVSRVTLGACRASFFIFEEKTEDGSILANIYDERDEFDLAFTKNTKIVLKYPYRGSAAYVAETGETLNLRDATRDPRFKKELKPGPITRSVLCIPIKERDKILGVVQVKNKKDGSFFNIWDEKLCSTFAVYCSFALHYSRNYKEMQKNQILSLSISNLTNYQLRPCLHEFEEFLSNPYPKVPSDFNNFNWHIRDEMQPSINKFILYMFVKTFGSCFFVLESTILFILEVRKAYENHPYNNFQHAFEFLHAVYTILVRNGEKFTHIEKKGLLIGGFCHSLYHSTLTNHTLKLVNDDITFLYDEYTARQSYCVFVTKQILNNCQIFRYDTPKENEEILEEIKLAIMGVNKLNFFRTKKSLKIACKQGTFSWKDPIHRQYVKSIIMYTAEISFSWKSYNIMFSYLKKEFEQRFKEGKILEKLGKSITSDMSPSTIKIKTEQLLLLTNIWMPCLDLLRTVLPNTIDCYNLVSKLARNISGTTDLKIWILTNSLIKKI